jgi:hypothetical protein
VVVELAPAATPLWWLLIVTVQRGTERLLRGQAPYASPRRKAIAIVRLPDHHYRAQPDSVAASCCDHSFAMRGARLPHATLEEEL